MSRAYRPALAVMAVAAVVSLSGCQTEKVQASNDATSDQVTNTSDQKSTDKAKPAKSKSSRDAEVLACMKNKYVKQLNLTEGVAAMADVYTTLKGDMFGPNTGKAKLIVADFTRCAGTKSGEGLVTVYGAGGDMLANGNF